MAQIALNDYVKDVPDFPKKGIMFKDIGPLLMSPDAMREAVEGVYRPFSASRIDVVAGIEARGFVFGGILSSTFGKSFIMIRKKGKLPGRTESLSYPLEYGEDTIQVQVGAIKKGDRVLIVDDVLATGGTAKAAAELVEKVGGVVEGISFVIELSALKGRERLAKYRVESLLKY